MGENTLYALLWARLVHGVCRHHAGAQAKQAHDDAEDDADDDEDHQVDQGDQDRTANDDRVEAGQIAKLILQQQVLVEIAGLL